MTSRPIKLAAAITVGSTFASMGIGSYRCNGSKYCLDEFMQFGMSAGLVLATGVLVWRYWEFVKPKSLELRAARIAFIVGVVASLPWAFGRLLTELWRSSSILQYLERSFFLTVSQSSYDAYWYDYLAPIGWCAFALAFWWRHVFALFERLRKWVNAT
jgi:hypothetical protein